MVETLILKFLYSLVDYICNFLIRAMCDLTETKHFAKAEF